jgi:hypothetical protein
MKDRDRQPSIIRAVRGPITLITVGVLFAFNNFTPYSFDKTWPVLLIVFGLLSLAKRSLDPEPPPPPVQPYPPPAYAYPAQAVPPNFPPQNYPPAGGYAQSPYTQPPAKGGFGTSAPPKPADEAQAPPPGESV